MIRITNSMMSGNTKNNINLNKSSVDKLNTMTATGQKIAKPSDDPVIAIRALRLNTNISQLNQYYDKNIPDAQAWMKITETALSQTDSIFSSIKENLTSGASDDKTASDRMKILESLKGLRDQVYASGNADYAGRTVFTGYRTGESLTYLTSDHDRDVNIQIHEIFKAENVEDLNYIKSGELEENPGTVEEKDVEAVNVKRIRMAYDTIDSLTSDSKIYLQHADGTKVGYTVNAVSIGTATPTQKDDYYTNVPDDEVRLIKETGELILGKNVAAAFEGAKSSDTITIEYNKSKWQVGDLRPEHYFACIKNPGTADAVCYNYDQDPVTGQPDPTKPNFVEQDICYEVSFNQSIAINTHASDVFPHDVARDVDELCEITQAVLDAEDVLTKLDRAGEPKDSQKYKAAEKSVTLLKEKMQKMFSHALTKFEGYSDQINMAVANIGSMSDRLTVTKERVADQLQSFSELQDKNINAELTDTAIDLSNAELALEAAQLAASKIAQQTLLNYL